MKKCTICEAPALYHIKDTSDYYCQSCAEENFADLSVLMKVEEEEHKLKKEQQNAIREDDVS